MSVRALSGVVSEHDLNRIWLGEFRIVLQRCKNVCQKDAKTYRHHSGTLLLLNHHFSATISRTSRTGNFRGDTSLPSDAPAVFGRMAHMATNLAAIERMTCRVCVTEGHDIEVVRR